MFGALTTTKEGHEITVRYKMRGSKIEIASIKNAEGENVWGMMCQNDIQAFKQ